jgi:hypothetical protein
LTTDFFISYPSLASLKEAPARSVKSKKLRIPLCARPQPRSLFLGTPLLRPLRIREILFP